MPGFPEVRRGPLRSSGGKTRIQVLARTHDLWSPASGLSMPSRPCGQNPAGPGTGSQENRPKSRSGAWRKGWRRPAGKSAGTSKPACRMPTPSCAPFRESGRSRQRRWPAWRHTPATAATGRAGARLRSDDADRGGSCIWPRWRPRHTTRRWPRSTKNPWKGANCRSGGRRGHAKARDPGEHTAP